MCIIAAKPAGVKMPSEDTIHNMWTRNSDGAGLMYTREGKVRIEKGFMDEESFVKRIRELDEMYTLDRISVVMHFRITTHGGTKPENCHPFPITDSIGILRKLVVDTPMGIAHNGIINIIPRKGISDTMEYIATQLAPLYRAVPDFYKNKDLMQLVSNAVDSRMAFLLPSGEIYTLGEFIEDEGIMYSNTSYKPMRSFRDYYGGCWHGGWEQFDASASEFEYKEVQWLDESEGEYVMDDDGELWQGDFAIDKNDYVYEYDYDEEALTNLGNYTAYNSNGFALTFNPNSPMLTMEIIHKY